MGGWVEIIPYPGLSVELFESLRQVLRGLDGPDWKISSGHFELTPTLLSCKGRDPSGLGWCSLSSAMRTDKTRRLPLCFDLLGKKARE